MWHTRHVAVASCFSPSAFLNGRMYVGYKGCWRDVPMKSSGSTMTSFVTVGADDATTTNKSVRGNERAHWNIWCSLLIYLYRTGLKDVPDLRLRGMKSQLTILKKVSLDFFFWPMHNERELRPRRRLRDECGAPPGLATLLSASESPSGRLIGAEQMKICLGSWLVLG